MVLYILHMYDLTKKTNEEHAANEDKFQLDGKGSKTLLGQK